MRWHMIHDDTNVTTVDQVGPDVDHNGSGSMQIGTGGREMTYCTDEHATQTRSASRAMRVLVSQTVCLTQDLATTKHILATYVHSNSA